MQPLVPPIRGVSKLAYLVIQKSAGALVPHDFVGDQVPIPHDLPGGLRQQMKTLLTGGYPGLPQLSLRDILNRRDQMDRISVCRDQRDVDEGPENRSGRSQITLLNG